MALLRLKELREGRRLTLEALSAEVEISVSQLSRYENGGRNPKLDDLQKLAVYFGISVGSLIGEVEPNVEGIIAIYRGLTPDGQKALLEHGVSVQALERKLSRRD